MGGCVVWQGLVHRAQRRFGHTQFTHPSRSTYIHTCAIHHATDTTPRLVLQLCDRRPLNALPLRISQHCCGQRVNAARFNSCCLGKKAVQAIAAKRHGSTHRWLALSQGAGFVKHHGVNSVSKLQRLCIFNQDSMARRHARACHDCGGCGQTQGARACNHQHSHRIHNGQFKVATFSQKYPIQQGKHRNDQHHRYKHGTHFVHQLLNVRLGCLRVFDEANNFGQRGFSTHSAHLNQQASIQVHSAPGHPAARGFLNCLAFPGNQGLIHMALAFQHTAIQRNSLTGLHHHLHAYRHTGNRQHFFLPVLKHCGGVGPQGLQRSNGCGGLPLGTCFQPLAQHHQGDHCGRRLKIQMRVAFAQHVSRQTKCRRSTNGYQKVHVARAVLNCFQCPLIKTGAQPKLHRAGQKQLYPARQHVVLAKQHSCHGQHQGQGEQCAPQHHRAFMIILFCGVRTRSGCAC